MLDNQWCHFLPNFAKNSCFGSLLRFLTESGCKSTANILSGKILGQKNAKKGLKRKKCKVELAKKRKKRHKKQKKFA